MSFRKDFIPQISFFQNEIFRRIGKSAIWSLSGEFIGRGSSVLAGFLAARILEVAGFGQLGMIRSTLGTFSVLAGFGLGATATRYIASCRESNPEKAGDIVSLSYTIALMLGTIIAIILFIFAPFLARTTLADPSLSSALRIGSMMLFWGSLVGVEAGVLAGFEGFRHLAIATVIEGVVVLVTTVPLAYFWGLEGAVFALVIAQCAKYLFIRRKTSAYFHKYGIKLTKGGIKKNISVVWGYSIPAFLCSFMYGPAIWLFNIIAVAQPEGYKMLGLMSAADQWRTLILFVPGALGRVVMPVLASLRDEMNRAYQKTMINNLLIQFILALCVAIPIGILSTSIGSLYGASFVGLGPIIAISCAIAVFHAVGNAAGNALMSAATIWPNFFLNMFWGACLIGAGLLFIKPYGVTGMAVSYLIAYFFHAVLMIFFAIRLHK